MRQKSIWLLLLAAVVCLSACKYDDDELWEKVNSLDDRVTSIEQRLSDLNQDLSAANTILTALQNNVYVQSVTPTENGYRITFTDGTEAEISNGKDGADGADGKDAPIITIVKNTETGEFYWARVVGEGEYEVLTDPETGEPIPAAGKDAITPQLKVDDEGYWLISYDNGLTFSQLTDEAGNPVKAVGEDGMDGDSFFSSVRVENGKLILTLTDGTELTLQLSTSVETLETIVEVTEGIGDWDNAYITPAGYFLYRANLQPATTSPTAAVLTRTESASQECLSFLSADSETQADLLLSAAEKLPLQMASGDQTLHFSYPNDSILELVYDDNSGLSMVDSIPYSLKDMQAMASAQGYTDNLKRTLFYFYSLVNGHVDDLALFEQLSEIFNTILGLDFDKNSGSTLEQLGLPVEDGSYTFVIDIEVHFEITIERVYHTIVLWTGDASFKVGGSSCTLSGTIWCPSGDYNAYGTYGIVCDENPENLYVGKAEYEKTGFQAPEDLSFEVDFRGFKPNTRYYYRAYYKFNSADHGDLVFKYAETGGNVGYDQVIKSFHTGDNKLSVDVVMCIDVTGSMSGIINTVKNNALGFYDAFNQSCTDAGIELLGLNTQVIAFQDINVDGDRAMIESPTYLMPEQREDFSAFVNALYADGGGDTPESGLEALDLAFSKTDWGVDDGYHRQVVILWTDAPYLIGSEYTALTPAMVQEKWDAMPSGRRLVLFAPNAQGYSNGGDWEVMETWDNVIHETNLSAGFSDFQYILDAIIGELTGRERMSTLLSTGARYFPIVSSPNN